MASNLESLPQLNGDVFLCDAGLETDFIFNRGIDIPEFAAHTLLPNSENREALKEYFSEYLDLAEKYSFGMILDAPTWKAHMCWAGDLGSTESEIVRSNMEAVQFVSELRDNSKNTMPIVLNGITGPCGDAYTSDNKLSRKEAQNYHSIQLGWLKSTDVDMVSAITFTHASEAAGYACAAEQLGLPHVVSFTVEVDGKLPSGETLKEAIEHVDAESGKSAAYFMINCAHPDHFSHVLHLQPWAKRIRGVRCNASRQSHEELDACAVLDDGDPVEMGSLYIDLINKLPSLNVFGGCCGSDIRHVACVAESISKLKVH